MTWRRAQRNAFADLFNGASKWLALGIGTTELTVANGYNRFEVVAANLTKRDSGAVDVEIVVAAGLTIYTANTATAQDSTHLAFFDAAAGGNQLTDWTAHNDIEAPSNGQAVQTGTIVITV